MHTTTVLEGVGSVALPDALELAPRAAVESPMDRSGDASGLQLRPVGDGPGEEVAGVLKAG